MLKKYADIIIDISHEAIDRTFQYIIPENLQGELEVGMQVVVPFGQGNRRRKGFVINITDEAEYAPDKMKEISEIADKGLKMEGKLIKLAGWLRTNYGSTMINAINTVMPVRETVRKTKQKVSEDPVEILKEPVTTLTDAQKNLVEEFENDQQAGKQNIYLIHGVTGSGKTEVYIQCIKNVIRQGRQAILLVPEIALTYQSVARFRQHFGDRIGVINSKQSKGEKCQVFMKAKDGELDVIIGPRSALFAPCRNLGLIVIDEEHDGAYKSDQTPKYHARDVAVKRAEIESAALIMGSATPTLESYTLAKQGIYRLWELPARPGQMELSETSVVDMRTELRQGNRSIVSRQLYELMADRLQKKEQIMLFINRRGYNTFVSCRECGEAIRCPKCDVTLAVHNNGYMYCHYCGYSIKQPSECPKCKSKLIGGFGTGTQKVESEIKKLFPEAKILRMDKDTTTKKGDYSKIINSFLKREADILIGTQMIVKGHDFPGVTLVGVMLADLSLFANDFRAGEKTFDLITQAVGRSGRSEKGGHAVIQTYRPDNYAIALAANQDYREFYENEMAYRRMMKYPPVYNMMVILMTGENYDELYRESENIKKQVEQFANHLSAGRETRIIGPSDATIGKINNIYRRVIYIKSPDISVLFRLRDAVEGQEYTGTNLITDINPVNMY